MKSLKNILLEDNWVNNVETKWKTPKGLFTKSAQEIADFLLHNSESNGQAMKRITFYINRAGSNLENKKEVNKAKEIIKSKSQIRA